MATAAPIRSPEEQLKIDARRLAGATLCDTRTAKRWLQRERVFTSIDDALDKAAKQLGIKRKPLVPVEKTG